MKNKKASIPVTLLVILTLALCIFALVAFKSSRDSAKAELKDYDDLEKAYRIIDYETEGYIDEEYINKFDEYDKREQPIKLERWITRKGVWNKIKGIFTDNKFMVLRIEHYLP